MSIDLAWGGTNGVVTNYPSLVGRYQIVRIGTAEVKVKSFSVGVNQSIDVPSLVTGATDDITWSKGKIEVKGSISAPLTQSLASTLIKACNDVIANPGSSDIMLESSLHGIIQAKVNSCTIECSAGGEISVSADIIGRLGAKINSGTASYQSVLTTAGGSFDGSGGIGADAAGLELEQIPQFDQVFINYGMLPATSATLIANKVSFKIDNKLKAAYVLGDTTASSLDAFSLYSEGRTLSGSMTFQSGTTGQIAYIKNAGMTGQATTGDFINFANLIKIPAANYYAVWDASPPSLETGLTTYSSGFTLLAKTPGFHMTIA